MIEQSAKKKQQPESDEFSESVLSVRRVTKVVKGGRRFAFSALVVVGNKKGRFGIALGKSKEASSAIAKAVSVAKKKLFTVPMYKTTVPYTISAKFGASNVIIRSASKGTGVIAGGAVRAILEAIGVKDVLTKSLGSANTQNVAKATVAALLKLRSAKHIAYLRGKTVKEIFGNEDDAAA